MHLQLQVAPGPGSVLHVRRAQAALCGEDGPCDDASQPPSFTMFFPWGVSINGGNYPKK